MTEKGSNRLVDAKGGIDMGENTSKFLELPETADMEAAELFDMFKLLYLDWLRFFRANMTCGWECPGTCPLPDDCPEIDRVWKLWLDGLEEEARAMFN